MPEWAYHDLIILSKGKIAEYVGFIMLEDVKKNGELIARLKRKKGL